MHAPARITSARPDCRPTISRRAARVARAVQLDLAVDLGAVEDGALDDLGIVRREAVLHGGEVRDRAAHSDEGIRRRPPVEALELGADRRERPRERLVGDDAVERERLGEPRCADVDAESLLDRVALAEGELRAAAAGVEHDDRAGHRAEPGTGCEIREPRLLLARDHLDVDAASSRGHRRSARPRSARSAALQSRRSVIARTPLRRASSTMPAIASTVRAIASGASLPASASPSPRRVTSARSAIVVQLPSACFCADVELHRVRADVEHGVTTGAEADELTEPAREARVEPRVEPEVAHRGDHERRIRGLDRDRAGCAAIGHDVRELGHAAADRVALPSLVHLDGEQRRVRRDDLREQLFGRVLAALERRCVDIEGGQHRSDVGRRDREARLHDREPLLQAVVVDVLETLDVHQLVANLHGAVHAADGEQIELVALLDAFRRRARRSGRQPARSARRTCAIPSAGRLGLRSSREHPARSVISARKAPCSPG